MSRKEPRSDGPQDRFDLDDVFDQLDELENTVTSSEERQEVRRTRRMLERVPGRKTIQKYTTRDIAEGFVGGIIFALPLLVEDGVFEIAEWFTEVTLGAIPAFLVVNILFVLGLTAGLLYFTDIRDVEIRYIFGIIPKRLAAVLTISFIVAAGTMFMWGRLHADDPTNLEMFARITVIWAAAALGATLGDILPGESKGGDLAEMIGELGDGENNPGQSVENTPTETGESPESGDSEKTN